MAIISLLRDVFDHPFIKKGMKIFSSTAIPPTTDWTYNIPWMYLCLGFSVSMDLFNLYLKYRELKALSRKEFPKKILDIFNKEQIVAANAYSKDRMLFSIVSTIYDSALMVIPTFLWVGPKFWEYTSKFTTNEYFQSMIFIGVGYLVNLVFSLPMALYSDFVIEAKHGFNKKTLGLFAKDLCISSLLLAVIGAPVVSGFIWINRHTGPNLYIWLWLFLVAISLVSLAIFPNFIAPLFNKFENLKDADLREKIEAMAKKLKFPLHKLYQMDGSKRSAHSNAYFYGFGKMKRVVLFDTLLDLEHSKIISILCHEMGHWKMNHTMKGLIRNLITSFFLCYMYGFFSNSTALYRSFGFFHSHPSIIGFFLFCLVYTPVSVLLEIMETLISRHNEYQADEFSFNQGYGKELQDALISLHTENKSNCLPDPWYSWFTHSHPTLLERLDALQDLSTKESKQE